MRRLLGSPTWMLLAALVGVSAALRAWAAGAVATPWIAPDELIYAELGRSLWSDGALTLFGRETSFFSLVAPALAGLPLSLADREAGYELLKALQAVVMSLAALPAYGWARELTTRGWALVAALLALVPPGLAYAGLIMTEVAFYPAFVLAAWAAWRALASPSPGTQLLALGAIVLLCAVRLQGFVVALAYLTTIAAQPRRWRAHLPVLAGLAVVAALWTAWQLRNGGPLAKVLGAYQAAGEVHYDLGDVVRFVLYHLADVALVGGVVPVVALAVLTRERELRAFTVFAWSLVAWLALQVGMFAATHIGHTAERNLFGLVPVLGIALVVWLARGARRPLRVAGAAGAVALLLLVVLPVERFSSLAAAPSNFTLIPFRDLPGDVVVPLAAAVLLAVAFLVPRAVVPLLVVLGVAASVATSSFVAGESRAVQRLTVGDEKQWIDVNGDVAFLYSDDLNWEAVWQSAFWNEQVRGVYTLFQARVPGGIPQTTAGLFEDGRVTLHGGGSVREEFVLASSTIAVVGEKLGETRAGYALWRVEPPFRLATWVRGVDPAGLVGDGQAEVRIHACRDSTLHGRLLVDAPRTVSLQLNGEAVTSFTLRPGIEQPFRLPIEALDPPGERLCIARLGSDGSFYVRGLTLRGPGG